MEEHEAVKTLVLYGSLPENALHSLKQRCQDLSGLSFEAILADVMSRQDEPVPPGEPKEDSGAADPVVPVVVCFLPFYPLKVHFCLSSLLKGRHFNCEVFSFGRPLARLNQIQVESRLKNISCCC